MNGAAMTQGIVEGNNEVLSARWTARETLKLQAAKASQESNGQSEEGLKKKERLKKKRSDRMDTAKSVAASFAIIAIICECPRGLVLGVQGLSPPPGSPTTRRSATVQPVQHSNRGLSPTTKQTFGISESLTQGLCPTEV